MGQTLNGWRQPAPALLRHPIGAATVAPFRAWRGSRRIVAEAPVRATRKIPPQAMRLFIMAERVGFEPTSTFEGTTGIPVQRLRPLGHLSVSAVVISHRATASLPAERRAQRTRRPRRGPMSAFRLVLGHVFGLARLGFRFLGPGFR